MPLRIGVLAEIVPAQRAEFQSLLPTFMFRMEIVPSASATLLSQFSQHFMTQLETWEHVQHVFAMARDTLQTQEGGRLSPYMTTL